MDELAHAARDAVRGRADEPPQVPAGSAATADRKGRQLTGERPQQGVTPDSLLALHAAGYRTVIERLGPGTVLDVGCGQGFESARFLAPGRRVVGVDYSAEAVELAQRSLRAGGLEDRPDERPGPRASPRAASTGPARPT